VTCEQYGDEFRRALKYLGPQGKEQIDKLEKALRDASQYVIIRHQIRGDYEPSSNFINWSPYVATRTTEGGTQSPALTLLHELAHAVRDVREPGPFLVDTQTTAGTYDNLEEKRVILTVENPAAKALGEAVRHNHYGTDYGVWHSDLR
jgi:hypothetical protein